MSDTVALRSVTPGDARLLFDWRNLPEIVALGSLNRTVSWYEHQRWFTGVLEERERLVRIIELDGAPVGQIRFDRERDDAAVVSIYLLAAHQKRGLGVEALRRGCSEILARWPIRRVLAFVREANRPSLSAFAKAGFARFDGAADAPEDHVAFALQRPAAIPHNRLTHDQREQDAVADVVRSGQWSGGPRVAELERALASVAGVKGAVCVGSGLAALRLSLLALGVGRNDRVAVPAYSCVALANAALALDAVPVPLEVGESDLNLDPAALSRVAPAPKAVVAVHTFGVPANIRALSSSASVIEDCAHAFGLALGGEALGARGRLAVISLYATKLLGGGEGGAVLSNDPGLLETIRGHRDYTDQAASGLRLNDKMTDLCAAIALCQLAKLPDLLLRRHALATRYDHALRPADVVHDVAELPDITRERIWYRYAVALRTPRAEQFVERMALRGVTCARPVENWVEGIDALCPTAARAYASVVSLPLYPTLREDEQQWIVRAFLETCRELDHG